MITTEEVVLNFFLQINIYVIRIIESYLFGFYRNFAYNLRQLYTICPQTNTFSHTLMRLASAGIHEKMTESERFCLIA